MSAQQHPSQNGTGDDTKEVTYSDSSAAIFSMYTTCASEFDSKTVENWKGGAESSLIFIGLFSSTVASFIALSYPNLQQDPNVITQSLLAQISQQLSNATSPASSPSTRSFSPNSSWVFVNLVWFLSLVVNLTCAMIATFLQQWARRYLQVIQRNHEPHVRAHIQEYLSLGSHKLRVSGLVEALPSLLFVSLNLFFFGLLVFAFLTNFIVATVIYTVIAISSILYITLILMPLIYHDGLHSTLLLILPITKFIWQFVQTIQLLFLLVLYGGTKQLHDSWGTVSRATVESFSYSYQNKAKSLSEDMISKFENLAKRMSMGILKSTLVRTLHWLKEDHELEEFVAGIPGLCESKALAAHENGDTQSTIRDVLATLPGPSAFHASESLPWGIIQLAQRALTSKLPKSVQQRRTRVSLNALYYIPGAIRDLLAPYAAGEHYCLQLLPLLNSPESLEVIDELWDTPDDDIALSVRCVAAVITAFMITPPRRSLDNFVASTIPFIWEHDAGKRFLSKRLGISTVTDGGDVCDPQHDSARLQNLVCFLEDITGTLGYMHTQPWTSKYADSIHRERQELFDTRHTEEYRIGRGTFDFDQRGDRASPGFVPAARQDLITLTLEILARPVTKVTAQNGSSTPTTVNAVANAGASQRGAFREALQKLVQAGFSQTLEPAHATASLEMTKKALEPVLRALRLTVEMPTPTPHGHTSGVVVQLATLSC